MWAITLRSRSCEYHCIYPVARGGRWLPRLTTVVLVVLVVLAACLAARSQARVAPTPDSSASEANLIHLGDVIDIDVEGSEGSPETEAPLLTCGIRADSTAACWGLTSLGNGSSGGSSTPVAVSGGHHFAEIAVLMGAACGLTAEGAVWCWGRNTYGQLGVDGGDALTPILSAQGVEHIGASQDAVVVTDANGVVRRWGGASSLVTTGPIPTLAGLSGAGFSKHSMECVRLADRQVYCYDEMWDASSAWEMETYSPVQPAQP